MSEARTPFLVEVDRSTNINSMLATRVAERGQHAIIEVKQGDGAPWRQITANEFEAHVVAVGVTPVGAFLQAAMAEGDDHVDLFRFTQNRNHLPRPARP